MSQSKYSKMNLNALRKACAAADIKAEPDWKKSDFVAVLEGHDGEAKPEELGGLPPATEAPDESAASSEEFVPSTQPPAAPEPPPPPPKSVVAKDGAIVDGAGQPIPPELRPKEPKRYRLMNDFQWVTARGLPVMLKAGRIMKDTSYDLEAMKARGAVLVQERVFEARKARE